MNYFDSDMSKSTNTVVYFDWKTVIYIYVCGQCRTQFMLSNISLAHALVHVTDFPVVNVHVDELSSARIWQHKLCATLSTNVNINYCLQALNLLDAKGHVSFCPSLSTSASVNFYMVIFSETTGPIEPTLGKNVHFMVLEKPDIHIKHFIIM
jgi:hypothetical protein